MTRRAAQETIWLDQFVAARHARFEPREGGLGERSTDPLPASLFSVRLITGFGVSKRCVSQGSRARIFAQPVHDTASAGGRDQQG